MNISSAVRHLLHRYDCVVIPGLGAFVCNYEAARIHPVQHKFYPPSKRITFNQLLQVNDGLLAHFMAQQAGTSYEKAVELIREEIGLWNKKLGSGEAVSLEGVGGFKKNKEGRLVFEADDQVNYLRESFGLTVFQSLPIARQEGLKAIHSQPVAEKKMVTSPGFAWDRLANYSSAAAVLSLIALTTFKLDLIGGDQLSRIGMNVFQSETPAYHEILYTAPEITAEGKSTDLDRAISESNANFMDYALLDDHYVIKLENESTTESKAVNVSGPYHVVAGCFSVESNAIRLNKKLSKKGFQAGMPGIHHGLHVVSYGSFANKSEARQLLKTVQQEENSAAWILKK